VKEPYFFMTVKFIAVKKGEKEPVHELEGEWFTSL
jgi:hypothetical protein